LGESNSVSPALACLKSCALNSMLIIDNVHHRFLIIISSSLITIIYYYDLLWWLVNINDQICLSVSTSIPSYWLSISTNAIDDCQYQYQLSAIIIILFDLY
jgi:hypothetical protein